jgi:hypothetical protein
VGDPLLSPPARGATRSRLILILLIEIAADSLGCVAFYAASWAWNGLLARVK